MTLEVSGVSLVFDLLNQANILAKNIKKILSGPVHWAPCALPAFLALSEGVTSTKAHKHYKNCSGEGIAHPPTKHFLIFRPPTRSRVPARSRRKQKVCFLGPRIQRVLRSRVGTRLEI